MEIFLAVVLGAVFLCGLFSLVVGGTSWLGAEGPREEEESSFLFWMGFSERYFIFRSRKKTKIIYKLVIEYDFSRVQHKLF